MAATSELPAGFNLLDPETFAHGHPHDAYDALRRTYPVALHPGSAAQPPFWVLTRYADIQAVSMDGERFTSSKGFRVATDSRAAMDPEIGRVLSRFMLAMDRPEHDQFRGVASPWFTPPALRRLEPRIAGNVSHLMERLAGREIVDVVDDVAAMVPIRTVCAIFGLPPEDEQTVYDLTNAVFGTDDPDLTPSLEEANRKYLAIFDYAMALYAERRRRPQDDLATALANARIGDRPLDDTELKSFFSNIMAAGNETTRSSLAGALLALARNPDQRALLVREPDLLPGAINELLRHFSPVFQMARTAKVEVEIGGRRVQAGDRVVMLYGAGNHDPEVFEAPHALDLRRGNAARHLTFGMGVHHCLGSRLAALQLRLILGEFLQRFPDYEIEAEPVFVRTNFVQAMKTFPIRLAPRAISA